jgi:hypothetical protein
MPSVVSHSSATLRTWAEVRQDLPFDMAEQVPRAAVAGDL